MVGGIAEAQFRRLPACRGEREAPHLWRLLFFPLASCTLSVGSRSKPEPMSGVCASTLRCPATANIGRVADGEGFEPPVSRNPRRFSRPVP